MSVESAPPAPPATTAADGPPPPVQYIPRPDPLYHTILLVISVGILVLSLLLSVREERQVLIPILGAPLPELCMFKRTVGIGCPGCGMTRSFISLAHGDWRAAWRYNPGGPLLFAMLAFQIPFRLVQIARIHYSRPELRLGRWPQLFFGLLGFLLISQWILRLCGISF